MLETPLSSLILQRSDSIFTKQRAQLGGPTSTEPRMCHSFVSFVAPLPVLCTAVSSTSHHVSVAQCNINRTSDPSREDEIAAKVARLRGLRNKKRFRSQSPASNHGDMHKQEPSTPINSYLTPSGLSFEDLPDWKKEEILESQIADAENFLYRNSHKSERFPSSIADFPQESGDYQPKVSTWGVFRRPDNISKTFGGGRCIETGGVDLHNSKSRKRDEDIKKRLDAYRASRGIDTQKEEAHREKIEAALREAEKLMKRTLPYDAVEILEGVSEVTSDRSRLGGNFLLSLALAYEAVGRREDAREIYMRLRKNPFSEISGKAKQLLQGFAAMHILRVDDEARMKGNPVTGFALPDVSYASNKRYETVVFDNSGRTASPGKPRAVLSLGALAITLGPALIAILLILFRS